MRPEPDRETREARRRAWINRFIERQRRLRQWISFLDLADWCAQSTTTASLAAQAEARILSLELLAGSILKAEFERGGRSKILFLHSRVTGLGGIPCRLEKEGFATQFRYAAAMTPASPLPLEMLARCWLPRELARQWMEVHGYHRPLHLDPERASAAFSEETRPPPPLTGPGPAIIDSARAGGRKPVKRRPSRQKPFWLDARKVALEWFDENGYPRPGDGGQAKLEGHITDWLSEHGHTASESTIRKYVRSWIEEYKIRVSAPE